MYQHLLAGYFTVRLASITLSRQIFTSIPPPVLLSWKFTQLGLTTTDLDTWKLDQSRLSKPN